MSVARRVGVLTFHRCINYGSYWQARCLVEGIRERGQDAVIVDHDSWRVNRAEWKCALRPHEPAPTPPADSLRYAGKMLRFARALSGLPRSRRFALERAERMEPFDVVVVGSDEVWNLTHPWYTANPLFYGVGVRAGRLVSYAASFGNYDASWGLQPWWADQLRRFEAISVRDENSRRLVRDALGTDPQLVLDPCLLFPVRPEGRWRGPDEPFVVVYGHGFTESFARRARRWARERGYRLVSIGYRNAWADQQWLTAGPHDFAHCFARAGAVITNFFHGCVFALRNTKPFACETMPYRTHKIQGLLAKVGADAHLVTETTPREHLEARLDQPLDAGILLQLDRLRASSSAYLDRAVA